MENLKEKNEVLKMKNGITLISLVITIIILLILATISIQSLTNTGLFKKAQEAKDKMEGKSLEENEILTNYLEQMDAILGEQITDTIPDGATVMPINDVPTWLKTGGLSKRYSYTTIEQVIVDNTCIENLINNENAMKYLTRSTDFASAICTSETTMTFLGKSAYVEDIILNSDLWVSKLGESQYYDKIFPIVKVHSSALANISFNGHSFKSNANGNTDHSMPWGVISISDSVSGNSYEINIGKDTKDVYVMPEGALYWYGYIKPDAFDNIINPLYNTGGWTTMNENPFSFETNRIVVNSKTCNTSSTSLLPTKQKMTSVTMKAYIEFKCSYAPDTSSNYYQNPIVMFGKYYQCFQSEYPTNKGLITRMYTNNWTNTQYCTNTNAEKSSPLLCKIEYDNGRCNFSINNQSLSKTLSFNNSVGEPLFGLLASRTGTWQNYGIDYIILKVERE